MTRLCAVVALWAAACGGAAPAPIALELGGTADDGSGFSALAGDAPLVRGAQGGFHVWLKIRVFGMDAQKAYLVRSASRVHDGRAILDATPVAEDIGESGYWESAATPSFMCPTPIGVRVRDEPIELRVELRDQDRRPLVDGAARIVPRCPPGDELCARICSG